MTGHLDFSLHRKDGLARADPLLHAPASAVPNTFTLPKPSLAGQRQRDPSTGVITIRVEVWS